MPQEFTLHYARSVKQFRKEKGFSQIQLELEAGLTLGTVSRIEAGKTNPTKETLLKIALVLELDAEEKNYLFFE